MSKYFNRKKRTNIFPVFFICILPFYGIWAIAGLETQLYVFGILIVSNCFLYILSKKEYRLNFVFIILILGFIGVYFTRIEGIFIYLICQSFLLFDLIFHRDSDHQILRINRSKLYFNILLILTVGGTYLIYTFWRILYFGDLFPQSYYMKSSDLDAFLPNFSHDLKEFFVYIIPFLVISIFKLLYEIILFRKEIFISRSFLFSVIIFTFFIAILTGDWMLGFRFYLPGIIFLLIYASYQFFNSNNPQINLNKTRELIGKSLIYFKKKKKITKNNMKSVLKQCNFKKRIIFLNQIHTKLLLFFFSMIFLYAPIITDDLGNGKQDSSSLNFYYYRMQKNIQVGLWINKYYPNSTIAIDDFAGTVSYFTECDIYEFRYILTDRNLVFNQTLREDPSLRIEYILSLKTDFFYDVDGISYSEKVLRNHPEFQENYVKILPGLYIIDDIELSQESLDDLPEYQNQVIWKPLIQL
ncbi:MAG: hypothetical protein ACFFC3_10325 [Candidatus Odinarchaeota archaeon]